MFSVDQDSRVAFWKSIAVGVGVIFSEITLNDLVSFASLIFIVLQIFLLIPKYQEMFRDWRKKKGGCNEYKK